ncbi:MAG: putative DNA binding domain-containing protein [bacterium]|nr:putative DNA binding domain-containing protein [bacterium]
MTFQFLGPDPLEKQISKALHLLSAGRSPAEIETTQVEIKEEPGRRRGAEVVGGSDTSEQAASYLAGEMACLSNTEGGGAIILGVADDGTRIGSDLNAQWLRHRIYELTERKLTVDVREVVLDECRLLVIATHEAIEPIRYRGRLRWRVNDNCVEVDPSTWHAGRLHRSGFDWSGQPSGHTLADISPVAAEIASRYLRQRGGPSDLELAEASVPDLVRRLNLADAEGILNNAGSLLFVATPHIGLDYLRRDVPGGDSRQRVRGEGPLLQQIYEAEQAATVANPTVHVAQGFVHSQIRVIPPRALREAIVNGVVHRDWQSSQPTTVEHVGETLTVTSPGGFLGGINPSNIISHPAVPRYRCLAEATAALGIAERQGIGIARMTRDLLALGRPRPEIAEIDGPYVRVSLLGGEPDPALIRLVMDLAPPELAESVDALLLIDRLCARGWVDAEVATEVLQRPIGEAAQAIDRLAAAQLGEAEAASRPYLITKVAGAGSLEPTAYRLSNESRQRIGHRCIWLHSLEGHNQLLMDWAGHRGRVSSTEAADLLNVSIPTAGRRLAALAEEGLLKTSRANGTGRGFHYLPTIT